MSALVRYMPLGIDLDLTRDDLGHPALPDLWEQIYRPKKWEQILQCPQCHMDNPGCPEWMYVQMRDGKRIAAHKNTSVRAHPENGQSDAHRAINERTYRIAERAGLPAVLESASATRDRITDVLVRGNVSLGVETQLSYQGVDATRRRTALALRDGLAPLWVTQSRKAPLIDQAPWARVDVMPWHLIAKDEPMPVMGGVRSLVMERCGTRGPICPEKRAGRKCSGWHVQAEPRQIPYEDLIVKAATGQMRCVKFPVGRKTVWYWADSADADQLDAIASERVRGLTSAPRAPREADDRTPSTACTYGVASDYRAAPAPIRDTGDAFHIATAPPPQPPVINWSSSRIGPASPCLFCGEPALMRDLSGRPCHKTCAEMHEKR